MSAAISGAPREWSRQRECSEAIHLSAHEVTMDCFAALAMTWRELFRSLHHRLLGRLLRRAEIMRGVDQGNVRQRLREIAGLAAGGRIELFGQQAKVVGDR